MQIEKNEDKWRQFDENRAHLKPESPQDEAADGSGNQEIAAEYMITLGEYASKIVKSIDNQTRTVVFYGEFFREDEVIRFPPKANKAWQVFKCVAEAKSATGEVELPEELRVWHGNFHRSRKLPDGSSVPVDTELKAIERHIVSCKGAGKRGLPIIKLIGCASKAAEVAQAATSKVRKCGAKGSKKIT